MIGRPHKQAQSLIAVAGAAVMRRLLLLLLCAGWLRATPSQEATQDETEQFGVEYVDELPNDEELPRISVCDFGWSKFGAKKDDQFQWCIRSFDYYKNDWDHADNICMHYNGRLVSVDDVALFSVLEDEVLASIENSYTFRRTNHGSHFQMWVGLGQVCPKHSDKAEELPTLRWTDGRRFDPNKEDKVVGVELLKDKVKNETSGHEKLCVALDLSLRKDPSDTSTFTLTTCDEVKPFICMKSAMKRQPSSTASGFIPLPAFDRTPEEIFKNHNDNDELTKEDPCGADPSWCPLERKEAKGASEGIMCYRVLRRNEHFKKADELCEKHNGKLASVHDSYQRDFLGQLAAFGIRNIGEDRSMYWIGLHQNNAERSLSWSDGTVMNYFGDLSFPKDAKEAEMNENGNCFALRLVYDAETKKAYNTWMRQRCDNRLMGICQKKGYGYEEKKTKGHKVWKHENTKCPEGMSLYNSMCYRVHGTEKGEAVTFEEARKKCPNDGKLVSITDPFEQAFVLYLLGEAKTDAWIGMEIKSGRMMWLDQEPISFTKFAPSHRMIKVNPEKYLLQNDKTMGFTQDACVSMDGTEMVGYWDTTFSQQSNVRAIFGALMTQSLKEDPVLNDTCDKKKMPYICEQFAEKSDAKEEEEKLPLDAKCETLVATSTTYCFLRSTVQNPLSYKEAQNQCKDLQNMDEFKHFFDGGDQQSQVAVVDDIIEWSFLMAHAFHHRMNEFWMGYHFKEETGFSRVDKGQINIGPWGPEEPNTRNGNCVQTRLGRQEVGAFWEMDNCKREKPVVCRITDKLPTPIDNATKCPKGKDNWIKGKTRCYFLNSNASMISTGYKADHDCFRYHNASLASFPTVEDFNAFKNYYHAAQLVVESAFIGLVNQDGHYGYTDHSPVSYTNWAPGEPSPSRGRIAREDCVHMKLSGEYQWQNENCWTSKHYICSVAIEMVQSDKKDEGKGEEKAEKPAPSKKKNEADQNPPLPPETEEDSKVDPEPARPAPDTAPRPSNADEHREESSNWVTVTLLGLLVVVICSTVVVYRLRRKHIAARMREHQIMQFDTLQNEDDEGL
uniref:C-type lectin domain-containing protein n=1 Tax=Steinernema glaseri TaxID=37863 RepID=A0A1I7YGP4_9BILA